MFSKNSRSKQWGLLLHKVALLCASGGAPPPIHEHIQLYGSPILRSYITSAHGPAPKYGCVRLPQMRQAGTRWLSSSSRGPPPPLHEDFKTDRYGNEFNDYFYGTVGGPTHVIVALSWPVPYRKYIVTDLEERLYVHGPWFEPCCILNERLQQKHLSPLSADFEDETERYKNLVYPNDSVMWFDRARQDYKLLQLVSTYAVDDQGDYTDPCFWIWWYSLQSNSWKKLPCTNFSFYTPVSACIDGVYYSAARLIDPDGAQAIMAFNLSTETLSKENLPSIDIDGDFLYWILEYKGLLSILVYPRTGYRPTKYELWVRKGEVWTKESVLHVSGVRYPTWFSKNGRLLYFESFKDEVVVFDRATGKSKNLGIHSHSKQLRFYPFAENFVQLNGVSVVEELGKEEGEEDDYGYTVDGPLMT